MVLWERYVVMTVRDEVSAIVKFEEFRKRGGGASSWSAGDGQNAAGYAHFDGI